MWTKKPTSIIHLQNFLSARRCFDLLKCSQTFCSLFFLFFFFQKQRARSFIASMHAYYVFSLTLPRQTIEPRSHLKSRLSLIVRVNVVLKRTVVVDRN